MDGEIWQRLMLLESHDLITDKFKHLHARHLSASRSAEIRSAARQSREYFRQAMTASLAVRPLLTFYGVASLSRSLTLLLRRTSGESSLKKGHGLETCNWSSTLKSDLAISLSQIGSLRVRTCNGLLSDMIGATQNRLCMHVRSQAVDWRLDYNVPPPGIELKVSDLLERLPDLRADLQKAAMAMRFQSVGEMSYTDGDGFSASLSSAPLAAVREAYEGVGYQFVANGSNERLTANSAAFSRAIPQFYHTYVQKTFGSIPDLNLVEPFGIDHRFSQLGITYIVSYVLGMLARYFPTHWMALIEGTKGDRIWPTLNRAQQYVETAFPELVVELIDDIADHPLTPLNG
jgi:hypothetical protein